VSGGDSLRHWLVDFFALGKTGLGSGIVDGFYFDDAWSDSSQPVQPWQPQPNGFCDHNAIGGPSEEDYWCDADVGLTQADTIAIRKQWQGTMAAMIDALIPRGAFSWQYFTFATTPPAYYCNTFFREWGHDYAALPLMYELSNITAGGPPPPAVDLDLAFFLLIRGPYAWIGFNWIGCDYEHWALPPQLRIEYGEPLGPFFETLPSVSGVFVRNFTGADVSVDCSTFTSTITRK
jgi:hypothetical protein